MAIPREAEDKLFQAELAWKRKNHAHVKTLFEAAIHNGYIPSQDGLTAQSYAVLFRTADICYAAANAPLRGRIQDCVGRFAAGELEMKTVDITPSGMEIKIAKGAFDKSGPKPRRLEWGNPDKNYWLGIIAEWEAGLSPK